MAGVELLVAVGLVIFAIFAINWFTVLLIVAVAIYYRYLHLKNEKGNLTGLSDEIYAVLKSALSIAQKIVDTIVKLFI